MSETLTLPSGREISTDRPVFSVCRDADDFMELKYALSERIIEIELQIDLYESAPPDAPDSYRKDKAWDWLPRAKAALKWKKLYRDEAQNRQGRAASIEKQRRMMTADRAALDLVRELMPRTKFDALMDAAEALVARRLAEAA